MALRRPAVIDPTYRYYKELQAGDDLTLFGQKITNLADPTSAQDAATKAYVDAVATGLDVKQSVRVLPTADFSTYTPAGSGVGATLTSPDDSTAHNTQDGVLLAVGNRLLLNTVGGDNLTPDADNGIYIVTTLADGAGQSLVLTRTVDFDQNAEVTAGAFTFVAEGTVNGDTGWVLITNDPITVDTTALLFSQFSSTTALTFDAGLIKTGASVSVELHTAADAQSSGADGGSSGLEFDVTGDAGKLRARVHATGGIERSATGLAVKLLNGSLVSAAGGLSVAYAPATVESYVASENITAGDPVTVSTTNNEVSRADAALASEPSATNTIGVAMDTVTTGQAVRVVTLGILAGVLTGATAGNRYYVATGGGSTTTAPVGTNRTIEIGIAKNATDLKVRVVDRGLVAA